MYRTFLSRILAMGKQDNNGTAISASTMCEFSQEQVGHFKFAGGQHLAHGRGLAIPAVDYFPSSRSTSRPMLLV